MNLQRDVSKTGKPVNIIQRLIDNEKRGGTKGEVKRATGWKEENYDSVVSYSKEVQMKYATQPVVIINNEDEEEDDE
jgi:hypothetical protein